MLDITETPFVSGSNISNVGAQREKAALGIERKFGFDEEIASLIVAEKGLVPFACPFDGPPDAPRRPRHQREFGIERVAGAEVAADVAGDDANAIRRDVENAGKLVLLSNDAAAAGVKRGAAGRPAVAATGGGRLGRRAVTGLHQGLRLPDMGGRSNARAVAAASPTS